MRPQRGNEKRFHAHHCIESRQSGASISKFDGEFRANANRRKFSYMLSVIADKSSQFAKA
jgi:hypothetical protein